MGARSVQSFVRCRAYGHSWDEFDPAYGHEERLPTPRQTGSSWRLTLRCTRCTTRRYDFLDDLGEVVSRSYIYPEGYKTARTLRAEWRLELRSLVIGEDRKVRKNGKDRRRLGVVA